MKKVIFLLLSLIMAFAMELDINELISKVKKNPHDLKNRLVIASYLFEKGKIKEAEKYVNEVLKIDPKNKYAKQLKENIRYRIIYQKYISKYKTPKNVINSLYEKEQYKELLKFYTALKKLKKDGLTDSEFLKVARVAMWEGNYDLSINVLSYVKNKKSLDYYEILAYDLYYKGNYKKAKKYFQLLYQTTGNLEYAKKLIDIYYYLGEFDQVKKLILSLKRISPKIAGEYEKKLLDLQLKHIEELKKEYNANPSFENMKKLAIAMFQIDQKKAFEIVEKYIKTHPHNTQAKVFYAQLLSWSGNNEKALKFLSQFKNINDLNAKLLLGKILAWQGKFDKAIIYLGDVYSHGNQEQKYEAKKMLGYVYLWKGDKKKAKAIFQELYKINPKDEEVKEELMVLNGNVKPLIKKYLILLRNHPGREDYILKLADYYYILGDYNKSAYYYEKYLKKHPENLEIYKTLGDIYLAQKNYYKGFSYWEYYANYKNTKEAYYELALRYYWNGFNKEALSVVNDLLKKYPNYTDALILKAKILKINPRFVTSSTAATIDEYFNNKSQQIQVLGDRAYFSDLYKSAIEYYKEYLFLQPNDYKVRERYAFALEQAGEPEKAAGEFYLLMWWKKTPLIEYHYAYNLQRAGKIKKAKEIYKKLLNEVPKPVPEFIKKFLEDWKKAWESMDINKYARFYDKKYSKNLYWRLRKQSIFKRASFISVGIYDPVLIYHKDNIYKVKFYQVYASKIRKDKGYKTLTLKCENNKCVIIDEKWTRGEYVPYNPENSLEKYIKRNLELINKEENKKITLTPLEKQSKIKPEYNLKKKQAKKSPPPNPNYPLLVPNQNKEVMKESEVLNYVYLKKTNLSKKNVLNKNDVLSSTQHYNWKIFGKINYFEDNQQTTMWTEYLKIAKHIKDNFYLFGFVRNYSLNVASSNKKGLYYGLGFEKNPFLFDVFNDNSGKTSTIGWDFTYYNLFPGITFNLNKHNMVYSRRSICSSKHTRIKAELTRYKEITHSRELWWSIAYELVDDSNNVITPQVDYDFYEFSINDQPFSVYFSGWYQFNSKQTDCYYSPNKTDTNIIGLKAKKRLSRYFYARGKGGMGYSFFDKAFVYKLEAWLTYDNQKNIFSKAGCEFSNSATTNTPGSNYRSLECELSAKVIW